MSRFRLPSTFSFKFIIFAFIALGFIRVMRDEGGLAIRGMEVMRLVGQQFGDHPPAPLAREAEPSTGMPDIISGKAQVYDGDTFDLVYQAPIAKRYRQYARIRLDGVDACESRQSATFNKIKWPCGAVATAWLVAKTMGKEVTCYPSRIDKYGRYLAKCSVDGIDLGRSGLNEGMLIVYRHRNGVNDQEYERAEASAKSAKRGLWSGEFEDPYQFRRQNGSYNPFEPISR
ncbi:endonuclease YncB(thermonuclease family) [Ochrobactrum sp. BH3]|nr:endonuclease YncB(thermonuclease family) [Ochrobactrum sp. BH3]